MNKAQLKELAKSIRGETFDEGGSNQSDAVERARDMGYRGGWNDATRRIAARLDALAEVM